MGLIDIIKPLLTAASHATNKSQQYQDNNSWECRELDPGFPGEKQVYATSVLCSPPTFMSLCVRQNLCPIMDLGRLGNFPRAGDYFPPPPSFPGIHHLTATTLSSGFFPLKRFRKERNKKLGAAFF